MCICFSCILSRCISCTDSPSQLRSVCPLLRYIFALLWLGVISARFPRSCRITSAIHPTSTSQRKAAELTSIIISSFSVYTRLEWDLFCNAFVCLTAAAECVAPMSAYSVSDRRLTMTKSHEPSQPKILARACQFCRARKIRCDTKRPSCSSCVSQKRECVYILEVPKRRYCSHMPFSFF